MKNLLIITQDVDEQSGLMSFFVGWIGEFAKYFDHVHVITLRAGTYHLPGNVSVYSLGKERGVSKIVRWVTFFWLLLTLTPRCRSVFAHMSPIFAIVAWPFTFVCRSRLVLWYLHRSVTWRLRLALALCDTVVTADAESLRITSKKIVAVGHGIDVNKFRTQRDRGTPHGDELRMITVGRISPIKDLETLVRAGARIQTLTEQSVLIDIVGEAVMPRDTTYKQQVQALVHTLGLQDRIHFVGYVPNDQLSALYARSAIAVGLTPAGGIDKTLLEAMASGCLVVTSNTVMAKYLGPYAADLLFTHGDSDDLAAKVVALMALSDDAKEKMSAFLISSVSQSHALTTAVSRIIPLL